MIKSVFLKDFISCYQSLLYFGSFILSYGKFEWEIVQEALETTYSCPRFVRLCPKDTCEGYLKAITLAHILFQTTTIGMLSMSCKGKVLSMYIYSELRLKSWSPYSTWIFGWKLTISLILSLWPFHIRAVIPSEIKSRAWKGASHLCFPNNVRAEAEFDRVVRYFAYKPYQCRHIPVRYYSHYFCNSLTSWKQLPASANVIVSTFAPASRRSIFVTVFIL